MIEKKRWCTFASFKSKYITKRYLFNLYKVCFYIWYKTFLYMFMRNKQINTREDGFEWKLQLPALRNPWNTNTGFIICNLNFPLKKYHINDLLSGKILKLYITSLSSWDTINKKHYTGHNTLFPLITSSNY